MFEKTQTAVTELVSAVTEDATQATAIAKATVVPAVAGFFGSLAKHFDSIKEGIEDGSLFTQAAPAADPKPEADPLPTMEQNSAINVLRAVGKTDEEIAEALKVSVRTVKMGWE